MSLRWACRLVPIVSCRSVFCLSAGEIRRGLEAGIREWRRACETACKKKSIKNVKVKVKVRVTKKKRLIEDDRVKARRNDAEKELCDPARGINDAHRSD